MVKPLVPRKKSPKSGGSRNYKNTAASEALRLAWKDPEKRAKMLFKRRGKRTGVPDGMRKPEADKLWELAREKADYLMSELEKEGVISFDPNVTEDQMAKDALREAFVMAMSPLQAQIKMSALKTVLEYTKAKPASKTDLTLTSAQEWLRAVVEDNKTEDE